MSRSRVVDRFGVVKGRAKFGTFTSLKAAGAVIRTISSRSVKVSKRASAPGRPPNTRRRALSKAILFALEGDYRVLIGPSADLISTAGSAHELGLVFRGNHYPERPFMRPALLKVQDQIPSIWRDSIREV